MRTFARFGSLSVLSLLVVLVHPACPPPAPPASPPEAGFTALPLEGFAPLTVQFTDLSVAGSQPISGYLWDFGDGQTSTQASPLHTYAVPAVYTVTLTVDSSAGSDTFTRAGFINVQPVPEPEFSVLFDTTNFGGVLNGPTQPLEIEIVVPVYIGRITTYHWNSGQGSPPGVLWLEDAAGTVLGPWQAAGLPGQGGAENVFWLSKPEQFLAPGVYTVFDSRPATWSQNAASGNRGFAVLEGQAAEELARGTVDAAGGILEAGGVQVEVPPDAFRTAQELVLGVLGEAYGAETPAYSLSGLPRVLDAPINFTIDPGEDPGEEAFVELAENVLVDGEQQTLSRWSLLPTEIIDGVLQATLPPYDMGEAKEGLAPDVVAALRAKVKQMRIRSAAHHFIITFPIGLASSSYQGGVVMGTLQGFNATLEQSFTLIKDNLGLSFDARPAARWPIDVLFGEFEGEDGRTVWGRCCYSPRGRNFDWIEINAKMLSSSGAAQEFQATMAHELFHLSQALHVNPDTTRISGLREMFSTWIEWRLLGAGYAPLSYNLTSASQFPLNGLLADTTTAVEGKDGKPNAARHGYASGLFARKLFPPNGTTDAAIGRFWATLGGDPSVVGAFNAASERWEESWAGFANELYSGRVPGFVDAGNILLEATFGDLWMATLSEGAASHTFEGAYSPLSARPFLIALSNPAKRAGKEDGPMDLSITLEGFTPSMGLAVYRTVLQGDGPATPLAAVTPGSPVVIQNVQTIVPDMLALVAVQSAKELAAPVNARVVCALTPRVRGRWQLAETTFTTAPAENTPTYTFEAVAASLESSTSVRWMGREYHEETGSTPYEVFIRSRRTWSALPAMAAPGEVVNVSLNIETACTPNIYTYIDFDGMPDLTSLIYMRDSQGNEINGSRATYINTQSEDFTGSNTLRDSDTIPWTVPAGDYDGQEYVLSVIARDAGPSGLEESGSYNDYLQTARVHYRYVYSAK